MKRFIYRIVLTATALFVVAGTMKAQLDLQNNLSGATVNWYISSGVPTADNPGTPATPGTNKVNIGQYVVVKVTPNSGYWTYDEAITFQAAGGIGGGEAPHRAIKLPVNPTALSGNKADGTGFYYYRIPDDCTTENGYKKVIFDGEVFEKINLNGASIDGTGKIVTATTGGWTATITLDEIGWTYDASAHLPSISSFTLSNGTKTFTNTAQQVSISGTQTNVGNYNASLAAVDNGCLKNSKNVPFRINKKTLTITANNHTIIYGDSPANNGVTYSGFEGTEDESVLGGTLAYDYTYTQYGNVGDYSITPKGLTSTNYDITFTPGKLTVNQKEIGLNWSPSPAAFTYDGTPKSPTATATGLVNSDEVSVTVTVAGEHTAVGNYTATASGLTGTKSGNYKLPAVTTQAFSIGKKTLTITANNHTITYGDAPANNGVTYSGFEGTEDESVLGGTLAYDYTYSQYGNVGDYSITPKGLTSTNYDITFTPGKLTVSQKEIGLNWSPSPATFTYDGTPKSPSATATGLVNSDEVSVTVTVAGEHTAVGNYTATASGLTGTKAGNYKLPAVTTQAFSIGKKTLTITANNHTITYGDAPANNGVTYSGFEGTEDESVLGGTLAYDYTYTQYGNVGDYSITPKGLTSTNYDITFTSGKLTVSQKEIGLNWSPSPATFTYDGTPKSPSATATGLVNSDEVSVTVTVAGEHTAVGNYTATASSLTGTKAGNYKLPAVTTQAFSIGKKTLTITANNHTITYGDAPANNGVTYSGFEGTEDESVLGGTLAYDYTYTQYGNVGDYTITPKGLTSTNYDITFTSGKLTVSQKEIGLNWSPSPSTFTYDGTPKSPTATATGLVNSDEVSVTVTVAGEHTAVGNYTATASGLTGTKAGNYKLPAVTTQAFSIGKKTLTITANNHTITYGDAPANNGVTYSGFEGTEDESVLGGTLAYDYTYSQYGNVGDYTITPKGLTSTNYDITFTSGKLTVSQKEIGLNWSPSPSTFTYDGTPKSPTATATGLVNSDEVSVTVTVAGEHTAVGNYTATASGLTGTKAGNYKLPAVTTQAFSIGKKTLTITANNHTIIYGDAPANNGVTYSGFEGTEDESVLGGTLAYDYTYTQYGNVGDYSITPKGLTSTNYDISFTSGKLTVSQKEIGLTWSPSPATFTYDGTPKSPTATATGLVNSDEVSVTVTVAGEHTAVGNYTATASGLTGTKAGNYKLPAVTTQAFSIGKKTLTITANNHAIIYGDAPANNGVTYSGFEGTEDESVLGGTLAYDYTYTQYGNVGDYSITPKGLTSTNYDITFTSGKLTVSQKEIGLNWSPSPATFTYDGTPKSPTATATGLVNSDEVSVTVTVAGEHTAVGNYTSTASGLTGTKAGNYKLPAVTTQAFSIGKKTLTITAINHTITYGDTPANNGVTYSGFEGTEDESVLGGTLAYDYTYTQYGNVGDYSITPKGLTSTNYDITFTPGKLTVSQKEIGLNWSPSPATFTYDGTPKSPTATATGLVNSDEVSVTVTVAGEHTAVGNYTATASGLTGSKAGNYKLPAVTTQAFSIGKKTLTITANNHTIIYGEAPANNGVTYSGFEGTEDESVLGGTLAYDYTYTQYGNVGDYTITPKGLTSTNYDITFTPGKLTVSQKVVGLNWTNTLLTFNGSEQVPTAEAIGIVNNDEIGVNVTGAKTDVGNGYIATASMLTGTKSGNYKLPDDNTHEFSIAEAGMSGISVSGYNNQYDGTAHGINVIAPVGATVKYGETVGTYELTSSPQYTNVCDKTVYYKIEKAGFAAVTGSAKVIITKVDLTITANNHTITYGDEPTNNGVTYSGFIGTEDESVLDGTLAYDYSYTQYGNVGDYTITPKGLTSTNYDIAFTPGKLTINQKVAGLTWTNTHLTYNGTEQTPTCAATGLVNGDEVSVTVSVVGEHSAVGNYTATASGLTGTKAGNYKLPDGITQEFSIAEAGMSGISVSGYNNQYDGTAHGINVIAPVGATVKYGETEGTYELTSSPQYTNVCDKTVYYKIEKAGFAAVTGSAKVIITKVDLTITANNHTITYGDEPTNNGVTYSGFIGTEDESVLDGTLAYDYSYAQYGNVGNNYSITPKGLTSTNYNITFTPGKLTVNQKVVGLTWTNTSLVFDGTPQEPHCTADGLVNNDEVSVIVTVAGEHTAIGNYTATASSLTGTKADNYKLPDAKTQAFSISALLTSIRVVRNDTGEDVPNVVATRESIDGEGHETWTIDRVNITAPADASANKLVSVSVYIPATIKAGVEDKVLFGVGSDILVTSTYVPVTDIYMPETEEMIDVQANAFRLNATASVTARIHTPLALLDDYALTAGLKDEYEDGHVISTVSPTTHYWTLSSGVDVVVPTGVTAYTCQTDGSSTVAATAITNTTAMVEETERVIVKANNGVLMGNQSGTGGTYDLVAWPSTDRPSGTTPSIINAKTYEGNLMEPALVRTHFAPNDYYILYNNTFHELKPTDDTFVSPCKAVLRKSSSAMESKLRIIIDGDTGIDELLIANGEESDDEWYTLDGVKLNSKPTKQGVYINNGKKVMLK